MFEVGFSELLLIMGLALLVLGPEKLPKVVGEIGRWMGRARAMARQFREQLEDEAAENNRRREASAAPPPPVETPPPPVDTPPPAEIPQAAETPPPVDTPPPAAPKSNTDGAP